MSNTWREELNNLSPELYRQAEAEFTAWMNDAEECRNRYTSQVSLTNDLISAAEELSNRLTLMQENITHYLKTGETAEGEVVDPVDLLRGIEEALKEITNG
jgi:hypothetical protein